MTELSETYIPFGKYCGMSIDVLLKDRGYCNWLLQEPWFQNYAYLYKRVQEYDPKSFFLPENPQTSFKDPQDFLENFPYFNLTKPENLKIQLPDFFITAYNFYLQLIQNLKNKILVNIGKENVYNVVAPSKFLKKFEIETGLERIVLKTFLEQHDLPNILKILERIKKEGGLKYKGNKGWLIAKERSEDQEQWWLTRMKDVFQDDVSFQFNFQGSCFDFLHIKKKLLFECKLNIKDFSEEQYKRYLTTVGYYEIIYLIKKNTIIHIPRKKVYTEDDTTIFKLKQSMKIPSIKTKFDDMIADFQIENVKNIIDVLRNI